MPRPRISLVWNYFTDITPKHSKDNKKVRKCKMCPYIWLSKAATTTAMKKHLLTVHSISCNVSYNLDESDTEGAEDQTTQQSNNSRQIL